MKNFPYLNSDFIKVTSEESFFWSHSDTKLLSNRHGCLFYPYSSRTDTLVCLKATWYERSEESNILKYKKNRFFATHRMAIFQMFLTIIFIAILSFQTSIAKSPNGQDNNDKTKSLYNESHALIIGVINYNNGWPVLRGVKKDVENLKTALEKQGFQVTTVLDPDHTQLDKAYRDFINAYGMDPDNRLILYFAGHGHTIKTSYGEEMGYIIPVDAANPNLDKNAFLSRAMTMQQIEVYAKTIQSKHALFLFDACFSGSIFALSRAIPENISYKTRQPVRQFITSGSSEETVPDESIFRSQFVSGLEGEADVNGDGFITGSELGEFLQEKVVNYSKNSQHPQYGKIRNPNLDKGDFVFSVGGNTKIIDIAEDVIDRTKNPYPVDMRSIGNQPKVAIDKVIPPAVNQSWESEFEDMPCIFSKIALRTQNGNFFRAEYGGGGAVRADREEVGAHETFDLICKGTKKAALKTCKGYYVRAAENNDSIDALSDSAGAEEIFDIVLLDTGKIALRSQNGKYLCANDGGGGKISSDRDKIKGWEVFDLIRLRTAAIKTYNDVYLRAEDGGGSKVLADRQNIEKHETFEFVKMGKKQIALKTHGDYYVTIDESSSYAQKKMPEQTEIFEFVELGGNKFALKAINGKYISAVGGGGFTLKADSDEIGDWQTFKLELQTP